jgi:hypothetical protein
MQPSHRRRIEGVNGRNPAPAITGSHAIRSHRQQDTATSWSEARPIRLVMLPEMLLLLVEEVLEGAGFARDRLIDPTRSAATFASHVAPTRQGNPIAKHSYRLCGKFYSILSSNIVKTKTIFVVYKERYVTYDNLTCSRYVVWKQER